MQLQPAAWQGEEGGLPVQRTSFVDRVREISRLHELLGTSRCVTLTGVGGTGKTRLALEVAARNAGRFEGAWLIELADLYSADQVVSHAARAMLLRVLPDEDPLEVLVARIGAQRQLLVLDGCESRLEGCALLADELLRRCAGLVILATSREPLSINGEVVLRVDPLEVAGDAVQLFMDRAEAAAPGIDLGNDVAAVRALCERLDGLPLAIELAAPWLAVVTPRELLPRLDDRFALVSTRRGGHDRQRTLRATVDWSHDLLSPPERTLFRRLAVFSGGFTVQAMEAVCGGGAAEQSRLLGLLLELSQKSLVQVESDGGRVRHRLLETLRQYAGERLHEAGETEAFRDRHLAYFLECAESSYRVRMREGPGADECRIMGESDNLLAALTWARDNDREKAVALAGTLVQEATVLVGVGEARSLLDGVLEGYRANTATYARALSAAAILAALQHDLEEARRLLEQAVAVAETVGYRDAIGWAEMTRFLISLHTDRPDHARAHVDRAVDEFERCGNRFGYVRAWVRRANMNVLLGLPMDEGELERGVELAREIGDGEAEGAALSGLGFCALARGERAEAVSLFRRGIELEEHYLQHFYLLRLVGLAGALSRSDPWRAMRLGGAAHELARRAKPAHIPPVFERALTQARDESRRLIGSDEADRAWDQGALMTRKEAVEEALRVVPRSGSQREMPGGLTSREFEVTREVAAGRTNREIAERLHLSVRTIENHVEHSLSKLGLNRRTQLAPWLQSQSAPIEPRA